MDIEKFKLLFLRAPEKFPAYLERSYPRLLQKILSLWDAPKEMEAYLNELVVDQRGNRQGFPKEVLQEILFISALHEKWKAEKKKKVNKDVLVQISPALVEILERSQLQSSPDLAKKLFVMKNILRKDDVDAFAGCEKELFNQRDQDGMSPLMHASASGAEKCMIHLLKNGGNPHLSDRAGNTSLHWAVTMGKLRSTEILLFFGANPMDKNMAGAMPLTLASIKADSNLALRLIDYGADANHPDGRGDFPLHKAVIAGAVDVIRQLLYSGANTEMRNREGKTALELISKPEVGAVFQEFRNELMRRSMSSR